MDKYSSPPLSGPHREREFSLLNPSFGLDPASFSLSNDSVLPFGDNVKIITMKNSEVNINNSKSNVNHSDYSIGSSSPPVKSPYERNMMTLSISQALAELDLKINEESEQRYFYILFFVLLLFSKLTVFLSLGNKNVLFCHIFVAISIPLP